MNERTTKILVGSVLGAAAGYFLGALIVEIYEQRQELKGSSQEDLTTLPPVKTEPQNKEGNQPVSRNKTDYAAIFKERPDIAGLIRKYSPDKLSGIDGIDGKVIAEDELEEDEELDEDPLSEEEEWAQVDGAEDETVEDDYADPMIISAEEYHSNTQLAKLTLNWFEDEVMTTVDGRSLQKKPQAFLGDDALDSFGELSGDEDIVYVRNLEKGAMYEVVRMNRPFYQEVEKPAKKRSKQDDSDGREDL